MHIVGIDEAIRVLSPHWEAIDQHFETQNKKFMNLLRADHTTFGRVIKCHLIAETYVERYLRDKLDLINLDDARLSFLTNPVVVIEEFTTLACTWLIVSPPHLEKSFARAFRNIVVGGRCKSAKP